MRKVYKIHLIFFPFIQQQYKEQQDVLKQQQQQELKQYYQRQMILNPNHKIPPPTKEMLAQSNYRSYHMEAPRKVGVIIILLINLDL